MTSSGAEQAESLFRGLLEAAPDAIVIVDRDGRIRLVNRQAETLFGYQREELLDQSVDMLLPESLRGAHIAHRASYIEAPRTRPMGDGRELHGRRRNGAVVPVEISLSPMTAGDETLVISVIRDITARRRIERELLRTMEEAQGARSEAEQANQAKSEFLSRMSHELRTPLNAILGFAQLLEMDPLTPIQHGNVKRILKGGRHLLDLINEVLDIARIETGRMQLSPEPIRIADVLREALDLVRPLADERNIRLRTDADATCEQYVTADRQRLKQVILNLLANGVKYNRPGGSISLGCTECNELTARIEVRDTGYGVPTDKLDRLFAPFDRLGAEMSEVEGTGLGLALSKALVEAMGGSIGVETSEEGSRFFVELALAEGPLERHGRLSGGAQPTPVITPEAITRTVLYIEDNLPNLELIEQILARHGNIRLLSAMQGRLGVELATRHQPDLVLLDLHLPDMFGSEVLQQIQQDPRTRDTPVVVISADATAGQIERLLAAGARSYLTKPLDVPTFLRLVAEILDEQEVP